MPPDLVDECAVEVGPARANPVGVDVLAAVHGRDGASQAGALVRRAVDIDALAPLLEVGHGAKPGHVRAAEVAEERERRSERRVELGRAQIEHGVAGPASEGAGDAGAGRHGQAVARIVVAARRVREQCARRQDGHAHRLKSKRRRRSAQPRSSAGRAGESEARLPVEVFTGTPGVPVTDAEPQYADTPHQISGATLGERECRIARRQARRADRTSPVRRHDSTRSQPQARRTRRHRTPRDQASAARNPGRLERSGGGTAGEIARRGSRAPRLPVPGEERVAG